MAVKTLRQARQAAGLTLDQVSRSTRIQVPTISSYETNVTDPTLHNCIMLENFYGEGINWGVDGINKDQLIDDLNTLIRHYPADAVVRGVSKWLRERNGQQMISAMAVHAKGRHMSQAGRIMLGLDDE